MIDYTLVVKYIVFPMLIFWLVGAPIIYLYEKKQSSLLNAKEAEE